MCLYALSSWKEALSSGISCDPGSEPGLHCLTRRSPWDGAPVTEDVLIHLNRAVMAALFSAGLEDAGDVLMIVGF